MSLWVARPPSPPELLGRSTSHAYPTLSYSNALVSGLDLGCYMLYCLPCHLHKLSSAWKLMILAS